MSCPTCDHTMQLCEAFTFWCPRCGTIKTDKGDISVPKLIAYTKALMNEVPLMDTKVSRPTKISVLECIEK